MTPGAIEPLTNDPKGWTLIMLIARTHLRSTVIYLSRHVQTASKEYMYR